MKRFSICRNIPFLDCKGMGFLYQRMGSRYWIEIPFISITFKLAK
jgi:hypothetical protein